MKKMGLDWGEKRIGIALSDELLTLAHPLNIIENSPRTKKILRDIIKKEEVDEVIVGFPITIRGEIGRQALMVKKQVEDAFKDLEVKLTFWDERFSTSHAEKILKRMGLDYKKGRRIRYKYKKKDRKIFKELDNKIAACLILQNYLDYLKGKINKD
jgi:putative Holliday junction resolvase